MIKQKSEILCTFLLLFAFWFKMALNYFFLWFQLHLYHTPNFKYSCPQLSIRMKKKAEIKNPYPISILFAENVNKKHFRAGGNMDHHNSGLVAETSGESSFSNSTNLNMLLTRKPIVSQRIASSPETIQSVFSFYFIFNLSWTIRQNSNRSESYFKSVGHYSYALS